MRPGDLLHVYVAGEPDFSGQFPVTADGKIKMPYLGVMNVAGKSTATLADEIARNAKKYVVEPTVVVSIIGGVRAQVHIMGAVQAQGAYSLDQVSTLLGLLAAAGGPTETADQSAIVIIRDGRRIEVPSLDEKAPPEQVIPSNVPLQADDAVIVPSKARRMVIVTGAVQSPGYFPLEQAETCTRALILAGGGAAGADLSRAYVLRGTERISVNLQKAFAADEAAGADMELQDKDVLVVPLTSAGPTAIGPPEIAIVAGAVGSPGAIPLEQAKSAARAVTLAGGMTAEAEPEAAYILREGTRIGVDVDAILSGAEAEDVPLKPNDILVVPSRARHNVFVVGAVGRPGPYVLSQAPSVVRAVTLAGGPTQAADQENSYILRDGETIKIDVSQMLQGEVEDVELRPDDMVVVPPKTPQEMEQERLERFAVVTGAVGQPQLVPISQAGTVAAAIMLAGGPAPNADLKGAYILRDDQRRSIDAEAAVSGKGANPELIPRDILVIPPADLNPVIVTGAVANPGYLSAEAAGTVQRAIAMSGGLAPNADPESAYMLRGDQQTRFDLAALMEGRSEDFAVQPGDVLVVPTRVAEAIFVTGAVQRPGPQTRDWSDSLAKALAMAQPLPQAELSTVYLLREGKSSPIDAQAVMHGEADDVALEPNDLIVVPQQGATELMARQMGDIVAVTGAVANPRVLSPKQAPTVAKAIAWCGGATAQADLEHAYLLRDQETVSLDLRKLGSGEEDAPGSIALTGGDLIVVPALTPEMVAAQRLAESVMVSGAVASPGLLQHEQAATVGQAVMMAGGTTENADPAEAYLLRNSQRYEVDLEGIVDGSAEDFDLEPGDFIVVPAEAPETVIVAGAVGSPGAFPVDKARTVSVAVTMAGGITGNARAEDAAVLRDGERLPVDVRQVLSGEAADIPLQADDVVLVPMESPDPVYVVGNVKSPGMQPVSQASTASKALMMSGGPIEETADLRHAYVLRDSERIAVNLQAVVNGRQMDADLALQPRDALVIPKREEQYHVVGAVATPGAYTTTQAATVMDAMALVGGPALNADLAAATILRDGETVPVDLEALIEHREYSKNVDLQPGDTLIVPEKKERVFVFGAVGRPGPYPFSDEDTFLDIIARAGGIGPGARIDKIWIVRAREGAAAIAADETRQGAEETRESERKQEGPTIDKGFFEGRPGDRRIVGRVKRGPSEEEKIRRAKKLYNLLQLPELDPDSVEAQPHDGDLIYVLPREREEEGIWQWISRLGWLFGYRR